MTGTWSIQITEHPSHVSRDAVKDSRRYSRYSRFSRLRSIYGSEYVARYYITGS
jgi:hypothetical protein